VSGNVAGVQEGFRIAPEIAEIVPTLCVGTINGLV